MKYLNHLNLILKIKYKINWGNSFINEKFDILFNEVKNLKKEIIILKEENNE